MEVEKTAGCLADGLRCNIWARAQDPDKLSHEVIIGRQGLRRIQGVLAIDVLKWKPGRNVPKPNIRVLYPILDQLGVKIAHFLVDFHSSWFPSLALPPSTGRHDQLLGAHLDSIIDRLEPIDHLLGEVQLFSGFKIGHKDFHGRQTIHCNPFTASQGKARMVRVTLTIQEHIWFISCR